MTDSMTVADQIAAQLASYGVTHMYSQSLPSRLVLACEDIGIRQVVYRTENAGGAMADAYARISGRIGVVCAQNGPAATLLVPPMAEALKASVPMLALVQEVNRNQTDKNAFQDFDHHALFASCTKWVRTIRDVSRVRDYVRQAFVAATSGRPGPVALMLPADLLLEAAEIVENTVEQLGRWPLDRPAADPARVTEAAKLLASAKAPLVIAGGGVHGSRAADSLAQLQDFASLPVGTTMMGKGSVDERHPLSAGLMGNAMGDRATGRHTRPMLDEADVIFLIGSRTNQNGTDGWSLYPETAKIVHLDIDGQEVDRSYPALRLVGDVRSTLDLMISEIEKLDLSTRAVARPTVEARIAAALEATRGDRARIIPTDASPIRPERVMADLDALIDEDTTVVADASYSSVWMNVFLTARAPGHRILAPRGLAGLGWGYPMALGAKLADDSKTVVAIVGDGGFGHCWTELETAVREGIAVTVVVLNNGALGFQKDAEHIKFGRHSGAVYFNDVDHCAIARACGCAATRVSDPAELTKALSDAIASKKPHLVEVITDPYAYPPLTMFDVALSKARAADPAFKGEVDG